MSMSLHLFYFLSSMTITTSIVVVFIISIITINIIIITAITVTVKELYPKSENSLTGDDGTKPLSYDIFQVHLNSCFCIQALEFKNSRSKLFHFP